METEFKAENFDFSNHEDESEYNLISDCCKPLFRLLQITCITVHERRKISFVRFFYSFLLLLICCWNVGCQFYPIMFQEITRENVWHLNYNDHIVVIAVLYISTFKNETVNTLTMDILKATIQALDLREMGAIAKIRKWVYCGICLAIFCVICTCPYLIFNVILPIVNKTQNYQQFDKNFQKRCVGINLEDPTIISTVVIANEIGLIFTTLCADMFWAFAILLCYFIRECYTRLNRKSPLTFTSDDSYVYKTKHQKITNLVNRLNATLSPAIITLVLIEMYQIIASIHDIRNVISHQSNFYLCLRVIYKVGKTILQFFILVHLGQQIRSQAQNGINVLLDATIVQQNQNFENNTFQYKDCKITTLFTSQLASTPVVISASDLFAIDYNLITLVISITITYLTIVSTLHTPPQNNDLSVIENKINQILIILFNSTTNLSGS